MGMHGNIILFSDESIVKDSPEKTGRSIISLLEKYQLIKEGVASNAKPEEECSVTFEEYYEENVPSLTDYAYFYISPENLTGKMKALVYLLDENEDDSIEGIELPFIEITVMTNPQVVTDFVSGNSLGSARVAIEFSYADVRLNEEIHRIRDDKHPFIQELNNLLGSSISIGVVCY